MAKIYEKSPSGELLVKETLENRNSYSMEFIEKQIAKYEAILDEWKALKSEAEKLSIS